jgi:hypothetical protein
LTFLVQFLVIPDRTRTRRHFPTFRAKYSSHTVISLPFLWVWNFESDFHRALFQVSQNLRPIAFFQMDLTYDEIHWNENLSGQFKKVLNSNYSSRKLAPLNNPCTRSTVHNWYISCVYSIFKLHSPIITYGRSEPMNSSMIFLRWFSCWTRSNMWMFCLYLKSEAHSS